MTVLTAPASAAGVRVWVRGGARLVLTVLAALLYAAGWVPRRTGVAVVTVALWCAAAVQLGWQDGGRRGPAR